MAHSGPSKIQVIEGDITKVPCDAIVNAANAELRAGGGVCGAIVRAAGAAELTAACRAIGHCPTGSAVITPAFGIRTAKHIIHAVGPVYASHTPAEARRLLRSAYAFAIELAARQGCRTLAFPAISTGIYGYPLEDACREAVDVCCANERAAGLDIALVAFDAKTAAVLRRLVAARN
ncbi:MAG TPA: macro domain-containing protein [Hyphomicrobium sp.]